MDKLADYPTLIKTILQEQARYKPSHGEIEPFLVFDDARQSYQLMYIGWDGTRRMHSSVIHLRLRGGKIWIEYDGTEEGIATALLEAGVPKNDIVLGFYSPQKRQYTDFAMA